MSNLSLTEQANASSLDEASQALFKLGRVFGKLPMRQVLTEQTERAVELSQILVVQAVEVGASSGQEVTVGSVAEQLNVDPSTASRLVSQTIRAGYLSRTASLVDNRAVQLALTEAGRALARHARRYQRTVFEKVTQDWTEEERQTFARLFVKFADAVAETLAEKTD